MLHGKRRRGANVQVGVPKWNSVRLLLDISTHIDEITNRFLNPLRAPPGTRELGSADDSSIFVLSQLRQLVAAMFCGWGRLNPEAGDGIVHELLVSRGDVGRSGIRAHTTQVLRQLKAGEIALPSHLVAPGKVWVKSGRPPVALSTAKAVPELTAIPHKKLCTIYGVVDRTDSGILCLFAGRPVGRTPHTGLYRSDEILLFQLIVDLLKRGIDFRRARDSLEMRSEAALEVLDRLHLGVVVMNQGAQPVIVNRYAKQIIARGDGLSVGPDGLRADSRDETSELRRLLGASAPGGQRAPVSAGQIRISRPSGSQPLSVIISPLRMAGSTTGREQPVAAVFICDPEQNGAATDDALRQLYGLTKAEAHLAVLLARGTRLVEASIILDITPETARTHLKRIFSKTCTSGQVELVHLLLSRMVISPYVATL